MKPRKLSPKAVKAQIARIDEMHDRAWNELALFPVPHPDEFGQVKLPYQRLRAIIKNRSQFASVNAFWLGWSLAKGDPS